MSHARSLLSFHAVRTEGGLLPPDILQRISVLDPKLPGTRPEEYHLISGERFGEVVSRSWSRLVSAWRSFQDALGKLPDNDSATTVTRERWLLPLFQELGYGRLSKVTAALEVEGKSYPVSHLWQRAPIHLLGCRISLEQRERGVAGAARSSPHSLMQELLNRSDDYLWGFLSNGLTLRLLRDHHSLTQQAYVEFDLEAIMEGEQYGEFFLLWLVCHQSRVEAEKPDECWLERWLKTARDEGVSALEKLRQNVEAAIIALGTGFLKHRTNTTLRAHLGDGTLDKQDYYRQLLRLVYRLIFLFVAEDREALLDPKASDAARDRYRRFYATRRLRRLCERRRGSSHGDLWQGLRLMMSKLWDGSPELGLPALGSFLWSPQALPDLGAAECANEDLLLALYQLCFIRDTKQRYPVNWRNVGADELGSIYESLLELHPDLHKDAGAFALKTAAGHERKTTGSYYTPTSLVDCLLDSALDPVLDAATKRPTKEAAESAILDLKVCDPACGSGHFLVAAARRIAKRLASVRTSDEEPSPNELQRALRDVVGRCVYGVDLNPMAVELCKVSLWMEAIEPGKPLSFLDSHIQQGHALLGTTPALLEKGIPDEAFESIEGDDKDVVKRLKKRNRDGRKGQTHFDPLFAIAAGGPSGDYKRLASEALAVERDADDEIGSIHKKEDHWDRLTRSPEFRDVWFLSDTWCAAFVWPKQPGELETATPTDDLWRRIKSDVSKTPPVTRREVRKIARNYSFFHWHLAFPQVFLAEGTEAKKNAVAGWSGGFDIVLGNPPWERIKLQEKEFFAERALSVANAPDAAARKKAIDTLIKHDPSLYSEFQETLRAAEGTSLMIRQTGRFPLCGHGDINTYAIFAELNRTLLVPNGYMGNIVPSGIATDETTKLYFQDIIDNKTLVSLFDFENREKLFPEVDSRMKFCLITIAGKALNKEADFVFFAHNVAELANSERRFGLSAETIALLNPNTRTCPLFRSKRDALMNIKIYRSHEVLLSEAESALNGHCVRITRMFDMNKQRPLFDAAKELYSRGGRKNNTGQLLLNGKKFLPLIEGKTFDMFDHRFAESIVKQNAIRTGGALEVSLEKHADPSFIPERLLYIDEATVDSWSGGRLNRRWLLALMNVTSATNHRTVVCAILPDVATDYSVRIAIFQNPNAAHAASLAGLFNSFSFDYIVRQKLQGLNLSDYITYQVAVPNVTLLAQWEHFLVGRVLELTYTAWDLGPFAVDCGYDGPPFRWDEERRFLLRCELDAAFFHLYGIARDDVDYIMETFPIVKRKDLAVHGNYRTKLVILDLYDRLQQAITMGQQYQTVLDPPPADQRAAHPLRA